MYVISYSMCMHITFTYTCRVLDCKLMSYNLQLYGTCSIYIWNCVNDINFSYAAPIMVNVEYIQGSHDQKTRVEKVVRA